ncbi:hypothetical protein BKA70DRAFT_1449880 [Coprinopsis sp. MPI-PUGE-AT-0042]|nr:hypothetical protein BKA70DRAFT_1449880 [Coprinopsis sp. MPI-PUGE-AT-0042]
MSSAAPGRQLPSSRDDISPPPLLLSHADELSFLNSLDLPADALGDIHVQVGAAIQKVEDIHQRAYSTTCQNYLSSEEAQLVSPAARLSALETIKGYLQVSFMHQLPRVKAAFLKSFEQVKSRLSEKRPFNTDCVPLLEKYFEYDPFPSSRDREWLAEKSGNTVEQIATWFQNHRRRAKEAGKVVERLPSHLQPVEIPLDELERLLSPCISEKRIQRSESVESDITCSTPSPESPVPQQRTPSPPPPNVFLQLGATTAPSYAFPTKFAPAAVDANFPCRKRKFQCEPASWSRRPATKRPRYTPYTVEQCCESVQTSMRIGGKSRKRSKQAEPWFASRLSGPLPAPHPASLPSCAPARESPSPGPSREPSLAPSRRTATPHRKALKPYEHRDRSSPKTPLHPRNHPRSPIPRMASNSSIASSGSSASEAEGPTTPEASPAYPCVGLPVVHGDYDNDSLFGADEDYSSRVSCSFGKPSLLASKPRDRIPSSTRSLLQRYGFARFTASEASLANAADRTS